MSLHDALKALHLLAVVVWVGGMAFVPFFLRPALTVLEPPQRLRLMHAVLRRFLAAVTAAVAVVLVTGAAMIDQAARMAEGTGGRLVMPWSWTAMTVLGLVMAAIFGFVRLRHFAALQRAMTRDGGADVPAAARALEQIRRWVLVNLVLGVAVIGIAAGRLSF